MHASSWQIHIHIYTYLYHACVHIYSLFVSRICLRVRGRSMYTYTCTCILNMCAYPPICIMSICQFLCVRTGSSGSARIRGRSTNTVPPVSSKRPLNMKRDLEKRPTKRRIRSPIKETHKETYGLFCDGVRDRSTSTVPPVSSKRPQNMKRDHNTRKETYKRDIL